MCLFSSLPHCCFLCDSEKSDQFLAIPEGNKSIYFCRRVFPWTTGHVAKRIEDLRRSPSMWTSGVCNRRHPFPNHENGEAVGCRLSKTLLDH